MSKTHPIVKSFTIKELRKVQVPAFQRWIVDANVKQLTESVREIGLQRLPVLCHVKDKKQTFIIDGNHMRTVIVDEKNVLGLKDNDEINCIYSEVDTFSDAAQIFRMLNTKGKALDWVDITNLYMHTSESSSSIYMDIWTILGSPEKAVDITRYKGFTISTIVNFLSKDTKAYREGEGAKASHYIKRKQLLRFLLDHSENEWDKKFPVSYRRPTGPAIVGFSNYWFSQELHNKYDEYDFLNFVNEIYLEKASDLKSGTIVINKDNAGRLLANYLDLTPVIQD